MKNNLQALRLEKGFKQKRPFANLLEVNEGNYGKMERGELPISANVQLTLEEKFPEYNLDWILLNKGDKLKKKPGGLVASDSKGEYTGYPAPADMGTYDTKYSDPAKYKSEPNNINRVSIQNGNYNMYMVPLKAYGGFLSGYESNVYKESLEKISFPLVRGECFAFEIEGFSMVPNFKPGDWFIGSRLEGFDWLVKNRPYVFVTVNGIILKIFNEIKDEYAHLSSTNEEYNPVKPMHLKEIKGIFHKEATVRL